MILDPWLEKQLWMHQEADNWWFAEQTKGLSVRLHGEPGSVGPHSFQCFELAERIADPMHVLEIGFNLGVSASLMLNWCDVHSVTSVDYSKREPTLEAVALLRQKHGAMFTFLNEDSRTVNLGAARFDFAFIDGDHSYKGVKSDIALCLRHGCEWLFFDDWYPQWGPGVQPAIAEAPLKLVALMGNMALCRRTDTAKWLP